VKDEYMHSLIATCLANPHVLAKLSSVQEQEGDRLPTEDLRINPQQLDLEGIRLTAGFITKTRHNPLRKTIPWTLKILRITGLEIQVFADYTAPFLDRCKLGPLTEGERTRSFTEFLLKWLNSKDAHHRLVRDVVNHETIMHEVKQADVVNQRHRVIDSQFASEYCIPFVRGLMRFNKTSSNPQKVIEALKGEINTLSSLERKDFYFCYWRRDQSPSIELLELDLVSAILLAQINGQRTIQEIASKVNKDYDLGIDPASLVETFQEAAVNGLINLHAKLKGSRCD